MEKYKAKIIREGDSATLSLELADETLKILLTEDKPNEVKKVFNGLLQHLKKGLFEFELESEKEDLFFFISKEYITQLNSELKSVYKELQDYELLTEEVSED